MKKITLILALFVATTSYGQYLTEGFEGDVIPPAGWSVANTNANQNWQTVTGLTAGGSTVSPTEGSVAAAVLYDVAQQDESLTSPVIDLTMATNPELLMDISLSYTWAVTPNDNYDITISVNQGTISTPIWTEADLGTFANLQWNELVLDLSAYVGSSITLTINYNGADGDYVLIDNIRVDEAPACASPAGLSAVAFSNTTSDIEWTNSGDFDIEWGEFPYAQGAATGGNTAMVTAATSYQITGLTPGVSYNVFVSQNCGVAGSSTFETVLVGTLPNTVASFPYNEDLEPDANQALLLNLGLTFGSGGTGNWGFNLDNLTDGDVTNDFSNSGAASLFSGNTSSVANSDATIFLGPFTLTTGSDYTFNIQQRNLVVSSATTPNKDIELVVATTVDGTTNTVIATFDDMNNVTYQLRSGTFTPTTSGDYYFGVRDKSSFLSTATSGNAVFIDDAQVTAVLSVDDFSKTSLNHFYNNATNSLNIELSQGTMENVAIYNLLGQEVNNQKVNGSTANIAMDGLTNGVYIAKVSFEGATQSIKFIKG